MTSEQSHKRLPFRAGYLGMAGFLVAVAACAVLGLLAVSAGAEDVRFGGNHGLDDCTEAGCLYGAFGVAVDPVNGDVYVPEAENERVSVFSPSGEFLFAFGYGVRDRRDMLETCTAATNCLRGLSGSGAGEFSAPQAVTIDSEGNVYVANFAPPSVEKFKPEEVPGHETVVKFVVAFGEGFIEQLADESGNIIAVGGPHDDVYVGDRGRVDVFERSGTFVEHVSVAGILTEGQVGALAVDAAGDMFVQIGTRFEAHTVRGVRELEPNGTEKAVFDSGGFADALAISATGDLYIADVEGGFNKILAYHTATDTLFESFEPQVGAQTRADGPEGMALSSGATPEPELYMTGEVSTLVGELGREQVVWIEGVPPAGPLVAPGSELGSPEPRGSAALRASIDPEGNATACRFEYDTREYTAGEPSHGTSVPCEPSSSLGEGFAGVGVVADLKGLTPSATYHWRVVASNSAGTAECSGARGCSPDQSFQESPAALVDGPWAGQVSATDGVLNAQIDPLGVDTTYRLEWGRTTAYEEQPVVGDAGAGEAYVPVSVSLTGLQSNALYHYRLVTSSTVGSTESVDHTFTTQLAAAAPVLPDGRAWEQVSPVEKHGAQLAPRSDTVQGALDGNSILYTPQSPLTSEPHTNDNPVTVISTRTEAGWRSVEPMPTRSLPEPPQEAWGDLLSQESPGFASSDLSHMLIEPNPLVKGLSPEATEKTLYIWDAQSGAYVPLVTPDDDETGEPFGGKEPGAWMVFRGATPDLSHIVLASPFALTQGAQPVPELEECGGGITACQERNLYEWVAGHLQLVNVLPNGQSASDGFLGRSRSPVAYGRHAVSNDGRWIVWTYERYEPVPLRPVLYVRDMVGKETFQVGGKEAVYETMSSDGSRVFYLEGGDLYEFDTAAHSASDITVHGPGETSAGVKDAIVGSSEDGRYVYVVATGDLTGSQQNSQGAIARPGGLNLYLLHDDGSDWSPSYIATLSPEDEPDWSGTNEGSFDLRKVTSHVSPDGRWLAFMSERSLTGYDNRDVQSGVPDEEVFLYDAQTGRLVCASCNPTGERPHGVFSPPGEASGTKFLWDPLGAWVGHWLAGSMPGWRAWREEFPVYEPRVMLSSGRLFFQSADALVPQDTNGQEDVYEYEPPGVGSCTEASATFSSASGGCVSLISSGSSPQEAIFYDASQSGDDVFFSTNTRLAWTDIDEATDVYDARAPHVPGEQVGFPEPLEPPACEGDACQGTPPSVIDQTPASLTFTGPGNPRPVAASQPRKALPRIRCEKRRVLERGRCVKARKRSKSKASRRRKGTHR